MSLICLITTNDSLSRSLTTSLPTRFQWLRFRSIDELCLHPTENPPDLVIFDPEPCPSPVEAFLQLHRSGRVNGAPVLAILRNPDDREALLAAGAADYLLLPCVLQEAAARIGRCLSAAGASTNGMHSSLPEEEGFLRNKEHLRVIERMAIIGRLTMGLVHEVNNAIQTIRGSLTLASESESLPDASDVHPYLRLCMDETERIINMTARIRALYQPPSSDHTLRVDLRQLVEDVLLLVQKELARSRIRPVTVSSENPPEILVPAHELTIAILGVIFTMIDALAPSQGSELRICIGQADGQVTIDFSADLPGGNQDDHPDTFPDLKLSEAILQSHSGGLNYNLQAGRLQVGICLPPASAQSSV